MIKLIARTPIDEDCMYIAKHARLSDVIEVKVTEGNDVSIYDIVCRSRTDSVLRLVWCLPSGIPLAISGIIALSSNFEVGIPWMLGTIHMAKYPRQILIESKKFMKMALKSRFKYLYNYVYDSNESSKRYLKAIGFKLHEPEPKGCYGALFRKFDMGKQDESFETILSGGVVK